MQRVRASDPETLGAGGFRFQDARLPAMLFRYRARNWPETLDETEREEWDAYRFERLTDPEAGASIAIDEFVERIATLREERAGEARVQALLDELELWAERVMDASA